MIRSREWFTKSISCVYLFGYNLFDLTVKRIEICGMCYVPMLKRIMC